MRQFQILISIIILSNWVTTNSYSQDFEIDFSKEIEEKDLGPLENLNKVDTLIIGFQGTDCGEWGGHRETIYLNRNQENNIIARFLKDTVACEIIEKNGIGILDDLKRVVIIDTIKSININEEKLVRDFILRITELCLKGTVGISNSGNYYLIKNTNNTLKLYFWNSGNQMETSYYNMRNVIFGIQND